MRKQPKHFDLSYVKFEESKCPNNYNFTPRKKYGSIWQSMALGNTNSLSTHTVI